MSDGGHNLSGSEDDEPGAAKLAPILGVGSRAFGSIDHTLQPCTKSAEKIVASETLWKKPLLTQAEILTLVHKAWRKALLELNCPRQLVMDKMVTNYVGVRVPTYCVGLLTCNSSKVFTPERGVTLLQSANVPSSRSMASAIYLKPRGRSKLRTCLMATDSFVDRLHEM